MPMRRNRRWSCIHRMPRGAGSPTAISCASNRAAAIGAIDRLFALDGTDAARYDDAKRAVGRRIRVIDGRLGAVRLSGDLSGEAWLREWLIECRKVAGLGALLLVPSAVAPGGGALRGRIV